MRPLNLIELAERVGGILRCAGDGQVLGFATDSRDVEPGDLFIAIRGANVDGHAFVETAMMRGAVAALVERGVSGPHIQVPNVVGALAHMALSYRNQFSGPVIGITGSAGKSSTKELLAAALGVGVKKTEGNRNTEYTAPLLWAEVDGGTRTVVVEMGMRGPGQIAHLASFSRPTIGVITNIGVAHVSELGSRDNIALAKAELLESLPEDGTGVFWAEDDFVELLRAKAGGRQVLTFGFGESADARIVGYQALSWGESEVTIEFDGAQFVCKLPVIGRHFALNAAAAFLAAVAAGVSPAEAARNMAAAVLPPMRMMVRQLGETTFLLDMYNASPPAVIGAFQTVREVAPAARLVAVLGEMRELGDLSTEGHRQVGRALPAYAVDEAVLLAANPMSPSPYVDELQDAAIEAGMDAANVRIASSHEEVKAYLTELRGPTVVLVKGSRAVELERAVPEGLL